MRISIGNLPVGFEIRSKEMATRITKRYHGFIQKKVKPILILQCYFSSKFSNDNEEVIIEKVDNNALNISRSDFICTFNDESGEIYMRRSIYSFDACLRVLYSVLFSANSRLLLHAAGIVKDKEAYLFLGPSGSGKTTIAQLSSGSGTVINDEIVAVKVGNNNSKVYGTPFWGEMRKGPAFNRSTSLHAIYFLKKNCRCYKKVIPRKDILTGLLRCCCIFSIELHDMEMVIQTAITLVNSVPAYELHFKKDQSFWDVV